MEPDIVALKLLEICSWHKSFKMKINSQVNKNELMSLNEGAFAKKDYFMFVFYSWFYCFSVIELVANFDITSIFCVLYYENELEQFCWSLHFPKTIFDDKRKSVIIFDDKFWRNIYTV